MQANSVVPAAVAVHSTASGVAAARRAVQALAAARAAAVSAAAAEPERAGAAEVAVAVVGGGDRKLLVSSPWFLVEDRKASKMFVGFKFRWSASMYYEHEFGGKMEFLQFKANRGMFLWRCGRVVSIVLAGLIIAVGQISFAATVQQKSFSSPEEAVKAAIAAAKKGDEKELTAIFGPGSVELLRSGDPVADERRRADFLKAYDEKNRLVTEGENTVLVVGNDDWPLPIPLVKKGNGWAFDATRGKEEVLNRRIGRNELDAIQVVLAYVDAQREYAMKDRDGDGLLEYAQSFRSDSGKKNGLYWQAKSGEEESPLGPFAARAVKEGYKASDKPVPFHGYYYRILTAQGKDAAGGAYSYIVKGSMIGGFALVAYPAEYGNSGVMTFIVNHEGKIFEKDLGKNTGTVAAAMKEYNPDKTWKEVQP